ncbi:replication-relaxation family protein [Actinomyces bowdenii]|uniref:Replication-relaxation family protein n=1 Tax=Actinomyces bowdenii TaxID=131109 RepID=A0A853EJX0_9ACTO|nr:replication-relaxation family protein [Actinomyces bowdenii]MBF0697396.1 replication-relaxation family protein [Actinomyces bowdenii]NYS69569.1 replication-relaxation family protein [Actinomyces bowdenii]
MPATIDTRRRIGRRQLQAITEQLDTTDHDLLELLATHRYATTSQLAQLTNLEGRWATQRSALRQTTRRLSRHRRLGLVDHLARRIGGVRAGSSGFVWYLREPGHRLIAQQHSTDQQPTGTGQTSAVAGRRRRHSEPSHAFLAHTLAITQTRLTIEEAARDAGGRLTLLATEPACWRSWILPSGAQRWLKPDLEAITTTPEGEEYHWLIEIDLGTENPARLLTKCHTYQDHLSSGTEQAGNGGYYPQVVWVMNSAKRAEWLERQIQTDQYLMPGLFKIVASAEQLIRLIQQGP